MHFVDYIFRYSAVNLCKRLFASVLLNRPVGQPSLMIGIGNKNITQ